MRLDRADGAYSLVEEGILRSLGVDRLEFVPLGSREKIVPDRIARQAERKVLEDARLFGGG
jgi:hypothetical protein